MYSITINDRYDALWFAHFCMLLHLIHFFHTYRIFVVQNIFTMHISVYITRYMYNIIYKCHTWLPIFTIMLTSKCSASNIDGDQVGFAQFAPAAAVQDTANRSNALQSLTLSSYPWWWILLGPVHILPNAKGLAPFTQLVKERRGKLVLVLPSIRFS